MASPLWNDVPDEANSLAREVIGHAIAVHRDLGPGLIEKPYKLLLAARLAASGRMVRVEHPLPLITGDIALDRVYVADIVVEDVLLIETKAVQSLTFAMVAQTKTYLRLGRYPLGLIFNFSPPSLRRGGIKRVVPSAIGAAESPPLRRLRDLR